VQKWISPQGGQVPYTDAAVGHEMTTGGLLLSSLILFPPDNVTTVDLYGGL